MAITRAHAMPFGAEIVDGGVRFRLWAPDAETVEVVVGDNAHPMARDADGWTEATVPGVGAGAAYAFRVDGGMAVPDPASRHNPDDVHGPSRVVDPRAYAWGDDAWRGRSWEDCVLYELHVGAFTPQGTYRAAIDKLDHLVDLGVTAIELLPVADFPGRWDWGYDGTLLFAPDAAYGTPDDLKALIDAAHRRGLMVFMDVVYNHFGPEGNYLHLYAERFFNAGKHTPWGAAINFDAKGADAVRAFYVHNALYWIEEYHVDGIRFDAVHAIDDATEPDILREIADAVRAHLPADRPVHLVLENDDNAARYLERDEAGAPRHYTAQWNDDIHHVLHHMITGEAEGYYADYRARPAHHLARCLGEGFAWQGERSAFRGNRRRGEPSGHLPPTAFVSFLQNHDQTGNRALGERIGALAPDAAVRAATAIVLLAPQIPMLFMGEEWSAISPFQFFCDFGEDLHDAVREGRRREFRAFKRFATRQAREAIPDPMDEATFRRSTLDWGEIERIEHAAFLAFVRRLLAVRAEVVTPLLKRGCRGGRAEALGKRAVKAQWAFDGGAVLTMVANLSSRARIKPLLVPGGASAFETGAAARVAGGLKLGAWTTALFVAGAGDD